MGNLDFRGELGRRLTIRVHGYEREHPQDQDDANWLRCSVEAECGQFRGALIAALTTHDFTAFLSELASVVHGAAGSASFHTMEESVSLRVEVDRAGRAVVRGELREPKANGATLAFGFESDSSSIAQACRDLEGIVAEFPERSQRP